MGEAVDELDEVEWGEGFSEDFAGTGGAEFIDDFRGGAAGDEDDGDVFAAGDEAEFAHDVWAIEVREFDIEDDEVRAFEACAFDDSGSGVVEYSLDPIPAEVDLIEFGDDEVVFGDEDAFHGVMSRVMSVQSSSRAVP